MFTDFVAECRADMLRRIATEELENPPLVGIETLEGPRPVLATA